MQDVNLQIQEHHSYNKKTYITLITHAIIIILSFFIYFNIVHTHNYPLAFTECITLLLSGYSIYLTRKSKINHAIKLFAYTLFLFIALLVFLVPIQSYGLIWSLIIPLNAFFILSEQEALFHSILFFFYFSIVIFFLRTDITTQEISLNLLISYLSISTISYIFAKNNRLLHIKEEILIDRFEKLSSTDQLTHLYNRVKLKDLMQHEINFSNRYKIPLCIVLIDIDHFKYVNDTYGHKAGDEVLQEFAKFLVQNCRKADIIARWGGEEFLIILPKTSLEKAVLFSKKLNIAMQNHPFSYTFSNTCSIGVSQYNTNDTLESLIERADKALYLAKNNGRNQTKDQNDLRDP